MAGGLVADSPARNALPATADRQGLSDEFRAKSREERGLAEDRDALLQHYRQMREELLAAIDGLSDQLVPQPPPFAGVVGRSCRYLGEEW